ncbi:Ribonuclease E/G [Moorella glycerini]|uniref:Ribonuclease G n=1 Tax=Neomoorella stamsii TaxID=1266720 RepID=A0A9X7P7A8_9FIRM|nr:MULTISPECIES: Rne/Rng family ribonuclease [Moorella]PRR76390.1 Ribonuclease G [Moorella stamsii]CEP67041.1 Ribonuclease E/G [Moorella glycerini]
MNKEILIQVDAEETAVAVLEDGRLMEIYLERAAKARLVGNIYKGRVANVLPGMQAAFVDIGLEKNAFLFVDDTTGLEVLEGEIPPRSRRRISDVVREGQEILVQVVKEPQGSKGARVTTQITLPGRYLVLMPTVNYIGISRRIGSEEERERLKTLARAVKPRRVGLIVRTAAAGAGLEELREDSRALNRTWKRIREMARRSKAPRLLHHDVELSLRILRDLYTEDVSRLLVNSRDTYNRVIEILAERAPDLRRRVVLRDGADLFALYGVQNQVEQALKRKVWLKCGGYLVIDQMEALTAIDVNTGKYVGRHNLADTVLTTNLEAAVEVARQLRLRNIGGIIIVDFIDMENPAHQEQVIKVLQRELARDKTKTQILGFTRLGLLEMTRKKDQLELGNVLQQDCPYCHGTGKVLSEETVALQARKKVLQLAGGSRARALLVEANPAVASLLIGSGGAHLRLLERRAGKKLIIKGKENFHLEEVNVRELFDLDEINNLATPVKAGQVLKVTIEGVHTVNGGDGIARVDGFVLDIPGGASYLGQEVPVEVTRVYRTFARARLLADA